MRHVDKHLINCKVVTTNVSDLFTVNANRSSILFGLMLHVNKHLINCKEVSTNVSDLFTVNAKQIINFIWPNATCR